MTDDVTWRAGLVDELTTNGWLTTGPWRNAFGAVPRHAFLPRIFALTPDGAAYLAIDEHHPDWLELVYRNAVWPTQLDADPTAWQRAVEHGLITGRPTCSSTQPSLMAIMLEALHVRDGHRVLEIGTGTGYNAALVAHRLGGQQVTSVDIDPDLIAQARTNLQDAGYSPTVAVADGERGHAPGGPYDRLIATCSTVTIPPAWIEQVRPGGFMPLRAHQHPDLAAIIRDATNQDCHTRPSKLPGPITDDGPAWTHLADLLMPGVARTDITRDTGSVQWLVHPDGSWAYHDTATGNVEQGGPQRLWDRLEHIHNLWTSNSRPGRDKIGITATSGGDQHVWLDEPANLVRI